MCACSRGCCCVLSSSSSSSRRCTIFIYIYTLYRIEKSSAPIIYAGVEIRKRLFIFCLQSRGIVCADVRVKVSSPRAALAEFFLSFIFMRKTKCDCWLGRSSSSRTGDSSQLVGFAARERRDSSTVIRMVRLFPRGEASESAASDSAAAAVAASDQPHRIIPAFLVLYIIACAWILRFFICLLFYTIQQPTKERKWYISKCTIVIIHLGGLCYPFRLRG